MLRGRLYLLILAGLGALVYGNSLQGSFHYDDFHSIVHNPHIRTWGALPAFFVDPRLFSVDAEKAMYRPLVLVSYAFNYALGRYALAGYHLVNLLLHLLCAALVWRVALASGAGEAGARAAGLLFAVHPLASEPVNYISARSESLAGLFYLAAFLGYLRWRRARRLGWYGVSLLAFACGLLSKSTVITLPALLLWYEWTRRRAKGDAALWYRGWSYHVLYWLGAGIYLFCTRALLGAALGNPVRPPRVQLWTQLKALSYYLKLLEIPVGLNVEHQFSAASSPWQGAVLASALLLVSLAALAWRRAPGACAFWLGWSLLCLVPTLVVPLNVLVNEHRLYLPLAGLAGLAGHYWERVGGGRKAAPLAALLIFWAGVTVQRNAVWLDEMRLWSDAVRKSPQMVRPYVHLGNALRERGARRAAREAYERALRLEPRHRAARTNLANLYYEAGKQARDATLARAYYERAAGEYARVLEQEPTFKEALNNLGSVYLLLGREAEAAALWQRTLEAHPYFAEACFNLAHLYARQGNYSRALGLYRRAAALEPELSAVHFELGNTYALQGRLEEAEAAYRRALRLDGADVRYMYNLGEVLLGRGERAWARGERRAGMEKWRQARALYERVRRLHPGYRLVRQRLRQLAQRLPEGER